MAYDEDERADDVGGDEGLRGPQRGEGDAQRRDEDKVGGDDAAEELPQLHERAARMHVPMRREHFVEGVDKVAGQRAALAAAALGVRVRAARPALGNEHL